MEMKNKDREFYPNACFMCYATTNLKRCSGCQMISYCSSSHQKEHWPDHKAVCRTISALMKELGVSHLFEEFHGCDLQTWRSERLFMLFEVQQRCSKTFTYYENGLFKHPRSCFVCYESRQSLLKSCPNCPSASFCEKHPSSPIHDEDCAIIRDIFETRIRFNKRNDREVALGLHSAVFFVNSLLSTKQSITMREFLSNLTYNSDNSNNLRLPEEIKVHISYYLTTALTAHLALKKLKFSRFTELTIHVLVNHDFAYVWEILFHLWPHLKTLNITFFTTETQDDEDIPLCPKCRRTGRKYRAKFVQKTYEMFLEDYRQPDIIIDSNFIITKDENCNNEDIKTILQVYSRFKCPIAITTSSHKNYQFLNKMVTKIFGSTRIIFDDSNPFQTLLYHLNHDDQRPGLTNKFLMILTPKCRHPSGRQTSPVVKAPKTLRISSKVRNLFYSSVCHVCGAVSSEPVTCKRCRMISYCGKSHQDEHQAQHRELCKVILGMLTESGAPNLFDKLKTSDSNLWLRAKLELLTKARTRLGRDLVDFEMQMFLFPKTCFVCHESDSSVLRNCKCGVHLCKIHKNDEEHKILCPDLSLAFKLAITERPEITKALVRKHNHEGNKTVPVSMDECIDSFIQIETRVPNTLKIPNFEKVLLSDFLTRPLTLLWCLKKFNNKFSDSLTVHVIGATNPEVEAQKYWKLILYQFHSLKTLKIIFIGPEITTKACLIGNGLEFPTSSLAGKSFQVETHTLKYEDYLRSKSFVKPGIVIGFNLNLRESDFAIFKNNTWKETIMCLKKIDAPFILTAGSKIRAEKDHEKFCQLFEKNIPFFCCEENPFAGLIPERDYETEKLIYFNKYVIIYDKLYEKKRSKNKGHKITPKLKSN